jgi:predicted pyridoxine 5'-phosphate oxidase superfamily flavin-nucleotide-binding protein
MAEFFPALTEAHRAFVARQPVFFVATAAEGARINLSPKGMNTFRVLNDTTVAYLDVAGSGNETNAHLLADGRITIMFCAFDNPALIFRIYGRGRAVLPQDAEWDDLAPHFTLLPGTRQIFVVAMEQVQTSCGWGVPYMAFAKYAVRTESIDGLPVRNPTVVPA